MSIKLGAKLLTVMLSSLMVLSLTGCWNYREIEKMTTIAGIAIDKGEKEGEIRLTLETVDGSGGQDVLMVGYSHISLTGETMFDIVRRMIAETGRKLYWAHAKVIILSQDIAREGAAKVIDWYIRDTETRADIHILVSKNENAADVLRSDSYMDMPLSFKLNEMLDNEKLFSSAPVMELFDFSDTVNTPGISSILPLIYLKEHEKGKMASIGGLAVFDRDRMLGTISEEDTKYVLFLRDEIRGGVLTLGGYNHPPGISLEIVRSKTKVEPVLVDGEVEIRVKTHTTTFIDEAQENMVDFLSAKGRVELEQRMEEKMVKEMEKVIQIAQKQYQQDIFGFGNQIHKKFPKLWKRLEPDWDEQFSRLKVTVQADVLIKGTASTKHPLKMEEEIQ
ncbi:Ger(x)C family spore germination protein [Paenibacillus barengoltzii]|uniref:Ger(x)C family spore germination protein n=1 Tax=Paenibacillus barengoltzii TaxID=343517 RepID=UPI002DBCE20A|nr:Ger(x)C family spore germination protein [Paenibacillus barengoltzii]MEC2342812.1 Ger(x)C family spore germination protein [Paenibacillus barengoltzii]